MLAIFFKELRHFFATTIGYIFLSVFLFVTGISLWFLHGNQNIFDSGFASLSTFFEMAPWLLLILIPAICMQSFAEEKKLGTLELLLTKPISTNKLVLGKFLGVWAILILALLPTLVYAFAIHSLINENQNIDFGAIASSYIALLLLGATYTAIGIFTSTLSSNQTIALILSVIVCLGAYYGFSFFSELNSGVALDQIGLAYHYNRINQGVLDSRDMIYFLVITFIFLKVTSLLISRNNHKDSIKKVGVQIIIACTILILGNWKYQRLDLTQNKRFSLSDTTKESLLKVANPIAIDILLEGNLPPEFKQLQRETKQLLETYAAQNPNIKFSFTNPLEPVEIRDQNLKELQRLGLTPAEVSTQFEGVLKKEVVVPWAMAYLKNKTVKIPLLQNGLGATTNERINKSVAKLEYAFTDAIQQLTVGKTKKVAILKGNEQLKDIYIADYIKTIQKHYRVAPFTLDSAKTDPVKTLDRLKEFDLVINAKPTQSFSEKGKQILDQHLLSGRAQMHLIDMVIAEKDSIFNTTKQKSLAWYRDLKLNDFFFSYGARITPQLIDDLYGDPLILAKGNDSNTQYVPYPWGYSPLTRYPNKHILASNLPPVKCDFANPIDTLKNGIKKTILLQSSPFTKTQGVPFEMNIANSLTPKPETYYSNGIQNIGVLLEGSFKSCYSQRILPFKTPNFQEKGKPSKLLIVSDGDIIKNGVQQQTPLELGFDPISRKTYGNKDFLSNATHYLLGNEGLVSLKSKQLIIPSLDLEKVSIFKTKWQWICLLLPLLMVNLGYLGFVFWRKRKYT